MSETRIWLVRHGKGRSFWDTYEEARQQQHSAERVGEETELIELAPAARIASLERQLEDARKQPWRYVDGPEDGADPRCLVTLEEDGMRWVGIRAWNANTGQWLNGGEPERARVMAWQPLPVPASGYWQHGKLVNTERT